MQELRKSSKPVGHKPFVSAASSSSKAFTPDSQLFTPPQCPHTGELCPAAVRDAGISVLELHEARVFGVCNLGLLC